LSLAGWPTNILLMVKPATGTILRFLKIYFWRKS